MPSPDDTDIADIAEILDLYGRFFDGLIGTPETRQIAAAQLTLAFAVLRGPSITKGLTDALPH